MHKFKIFERKIMYCGSTFIDCKKAYEWVRRSVLNRHNIQNEFDISVKVVRLIKVCSSEMYSNVRLDIHCVIYIP